jgi:tRNA threonylcarbamoyladenosine biosynthesis protein TsaB
VDGQVRAETDFQHGLQHAARIIPAIDGLCREAGWKSNDIREIYVSAGPGSFTGLRIGITLAKTLAFATGAALIAVPTVKVLVENAPSDAERVIVVLDAKRDQIFTAGFEREATAWRQAIPAQLGTLAEMLNRVGRPVLLLGEGIPYHLKFVKEDSGVKIAEESIWRARASVVARLGWVMARGGEFTPALKLEPIYIRRPEAEEKMDQARAEARAGSDSADASKGDEGVSIKRKIASAEADPTKSDQAM